MTTFSMPQGTMRKLMARSVLITILALAIIAAVDLYAGWSTASIVVNLGTILVLAGFMAVMLLLAARSCRIEIKADFIDFGFPVYRRVATADIEQMELFRDICKWRLELELRDGRIVRVPLARSMYGDIVAILNALQAAAPGVSSGPGFSLLRAGRGDELPRCISREVIAWSSAMHPGTGHFMLGQWHKAIPLMLLAPVLLLQAALHLAYNSDAVFPVILACVLVWVMAAVDAVVICERRRALFTAGRALPPRVIAEVRPGWRGLPIYAVIHVMTLAVYIASVLLLVMGFEFARGLADAGGTVLFLRLAALAHLWIAVLCAIFVGAAALDAITQLGRGTEPRIFRRRRFVAFLMIGAILLLQVRMAPGPDSWVNADWCNPAVWPPQPACAGPYLAFITLHAGEISPEQGIAYLTAARLRFNVPGGPPGCRLSGCCQPPAVPSVLNYFAERLALGDTGHSH